MTNENSRPKKALRLNYWSGNSTKAGITVYGEPDEVRIHANEKSFINVKEDRVTISGGQPSTINIQGLPQSMRYAAMIEATPWPLSMIPSTVATPIPQQIIKPPLVDLVPVIQQLSIILSSLTGI